MELLFCSLLLNSRAVNIQQYIMENIIDLKLLLSTPKTITLTTHRNPDGDAMGSMLACYHFLRRQNHRVYMIAPSEYPENFAWMMGIQECLIWDIAPEVCEAAIKNTDIIFSLDYNGLDRVDKLGEAIKRSSSKKVLIEIDKNELLSHRLPKIDVKVNSDIKNFLKEFSSKKMNFKKNQFDLWKKKILVLKNKYPIVEAKHYKNSGYVNPYAFFNELSKNIKKDTILIPDASANLIWCMQAFQKLKDTKIFTALNHSPMGYSVAASVGAFFGNPKKNIISIIGDGSMPMNIQELETIFSYNVNVKIFVINNNGYGLIKQTQETWLNSRYSGVDKKSGLSLPDNKKLSNAYGVKAISLKDNKEMKNKLKNILNIKGPMLIDLNINPKTRVAPKIEYGNPLHDMSPKIPRHVLKEILNN